MDTHEARDDALREAARRTVGRIDYMRSQLPATERDAESHRIMMTCISASLSGHYTAGVSEGRRQSHLDARSMFLSGAVVGMLAGYLLARSLL